jgi:hypothetical protein
MAKKRRKAGKDFATAEAHGDASYSYANAIKAWAAQIENLVGSQKTAKRYLCSIAQLDEFLSGKSLAQIDRTLLGDIVEKRRKAGVTDTAIKRDFDALSSVLRYAAGRGWTDSNPIEAKDRERVTIDDALSIIGISTRSLQEMAARGEIPGAAKFGRRWTFDLAKLRAHVKDKEEEIRQAANDRRHPRDAIGGVTRSGRRLASINNEKAGRSILSIRQSQKRLAKLAKISR